MPRTLRLKGIGFDGVQNYLNLGKLGTFGSNLGSGFYCKFQIATSSAVKEFQGYQNNLTDGNQQVSLVFNATGNNTSLSGAIQLLIRDSTGLLLRGGSSGSIGFNDGKLHTVILTANFSTNTITVSIDNTSQAVNYLSQQTPATFVNFSTSFVIAALDLNDVTFNNFFQHNLSSFVIGTSASSLYGSYLFNEGTGSTTADSSGQSNTATLTGSPKPTWIGSNVVTRNLASRSLASGRTLVN